MSGRPLLITDCDEVLLHMVGPFQTWLDRDHAIDFDLEGENFECALVRRQDSSVVQPGLSVMTSLPASIASMASAARSAGIAAISTRSILGSSSNTRRSLTRGAWGKRLRKPGSVSGSPWVQ